jgi:hypothetical protein
MPQVLDLRTHQRLTRPSTTAAVTVRTHRFRITERGHAKCPRLDSECRCGRLEDRRWKCEMMVRRSTGTECAQRSAVQKRNNGRGCRPPGRPRNGRRDNAVKDERSAVRTFHLHSVRPDCERFGWEGNARTHATRHFEHICNGRVSCIDHSRIRRGHNEYRNAARASRFLRALETVLAGHEHVTEFIPMHKAVSTQLMDDSKCFGGRRSARSAGSDGICQNTRPTGESSFLVHCNAGESLSKLRIGIDPYRSSRCRWRCTGRLRR